MPDGTRKPEDLQKQGTREFEQAISGKGPKMPKVGRDAEEDAELEQALKDSFPASDPAKPAVPESGLGAPRGRKSVE